MKALAMDDFTPGMLVFGMGRRYQDVIRESVGFGFAAGAIVGTVERQDNSYRGDVFRVVVVDLPFVVLRTVWSRYGGITGDKPTTIDLRDGYGFAVPSAEILAELGIKSDPPTNPTAQKE